MSEIKRKCIEQGCGYEFIIDDEAQKFFSEMGWKLPMRCKRCRLKRKEESK